MYTPLFVPSLYRAFCYLQSSQRQALFLKAQRRRKSILAVVLPLAYMLRQLPYSASTDDSCQKYMLPNHRDSDGEKPRSLGLADCNSKHAVPQNSETYNVPSIYTAKLRHARYLLCRYPRYED